MHPFRLASGLDQGDLRMPLSPRQTDDLLQTPVIGAGQRVNLTRKQRRLARQRRQEELDDVQLDGLKRATHGARDPERRAGTWIEGLHRLFHENVVFFIDGDRPSSRFFAIRSHATGEQLIPTTRGRDHSQNAFIRHGRQPKGLSTWQLIEPLRVGARDDFPADGLLYILCHRGDFLRQRAANLEGFTAVRAPHLDVNVVSEALGVERGHQQIPIAHARLGEVFRPESRARNLQHQLSQQIVEHDDVRIGETKLVVPTQVA